jgi:SAM-dependent methyltransferase
MKTPMTRRQAEEFVAPIIRKCLRDFGDFSGPNVSDEEFAANTADGLRPDVRRVSLLLTIAQEAIGPETAGEALEVGYGYGYLILPLAKTFPRIHWTAVEHKDRRFFGRQDFRARMGEFNCELVGVNITAEPLPFADHQFSVVTFSETLEHLPVERVNFVLSEISRVLRPDAILLASSPNQAGLENRLLLLKGKSILDLPDEMATAKGIFGHIRLYTPAEVKAHFAKFGFSLQSVVLESNNSGNRGVGSGGLHRKLYRLYERLEEKVRFLRKFGDTWYMVFRKNT